MRFIIVPTVVLALALGGNQSLQAQGQGPDDCEKCEQEDLTRWPKCETAVWPEEGWFDCHAFGEECGGQEQCFGQTFSQTDATPWSVRPDGTVLLEPVLAELPAATLAAPEGPLAGARPDAYRVSPEARLHERTCQGVITLRVYGDVVSAALRHRSEVLIL